MNEKIDLSYNKESFSSIFKEKLFMLETINECGKRINEIEKKINQYDLYDCEEKNHLILYFTNIKIVIFDTNYFYAIWINKIKEYANRIITMENNDKSYYFWNSFPTDTSLYDNDCYNELDKEAKEDYAYTYFNKLCIDACDDDEERANNLFKLIEGLFSYIWKRYLKFINIENENVPEFFKQSLVKKEEEEEKNEEKITSNKNHSNNMNAINIGIPGIMLVMFAILTIIGLFSSDSSSVGYCILFLIISGVWLFIGINLSKNTCNNCGKYNGYEVISEMEIDSYITTKTRYRRTPYGSNIPYDVPVTISKISQTLKCKNCGNITHKTIEREK